MSRSLNHGFEDKCSEETFTEIYNMAYARGVEKGKDIGRADERERIIKELEEFAKNPCEGKYCKYPDDPENPSDENIGCERCVALRAIEIVRGGE